MGYPFIGIRLLSHHDTVRKCPQVNVRACLHRRVDIKLSSWLGTLEMIHATINLAYTWYRLYLVRFVIKK